MTPPLKNIYSCEDPQSASEYLQYNSANRRKEEEEEEKEEEEEEEEGGGFDHNYMER
jgi:hypothetical protein